MNRALTATVLAAVLVATSATTTRAAASSVVVSRHGIGAVRFGLPQRQAVAELSRLFGRSSRALANSGCGPRYTEVAWGHLYAEFRLGRFTGFRYMENAWLPQPAQRKPTPPSRPRPELKTAKGISLTSTLGELRAAYGRLNLIGTDRWETPDGLVFYDNARHDPPPASSRIIEIKFGTCGDF